MLIYSWLGLNPNSYILTLCNHIHGWDSWMTLFVFGLTVEKNFLLLLYLNNCHPTIKFTMEASNLQVNWLDTTVLLENGKIEINLYFKPTDSYNYLLYSSAHPQKCKDSIPFGQFLRTRRISSKIEDFDRNTLDFSQHFLRRNYPIHLLEEAAIKLFWSYMCSPRGRCGA